MNWQHNYRSMLVIYIALFLALTFPYWLNGEVIAPYSPSAEIAAPDTYDSAHIENRKFSDFVYAYIPEISINLDGKKSGWLPLWTNLNELGRPTFLSGFSRSYLPTWIIECITDNPHRILTLLSLSISFLSGFFVLLLCKELKLAPLAGLLASASLAASPFIMYWLTFPMFTSSLCWSAGILYALTRLRQKLDLLSWGLLAFCVYSLLMTAYPQSVVIHAYILMGYGTHLAYAQWKVGGEKSTAQYLVTVTSAVVIGGALALPIYLDIAMMAADSARAAPDPSFFTSFLPDIDSLFTATDFLVFSTFPEIFGNPISPSIAYTYDGLSTTPLISFLVLIGLMLCFRKIWGWWLAVAIICSLSFFPSIYLLGVKYLGFNLSPVNPIGYIALPMIMISAYGADALTRHMSNFHRYKAIAIATAGTIFALLVSIYFGIEHELKIHWGMVAVMLATIGFLAAQLNKVRPILLLAALLTTGIFISFPLMLRQEVSQIATSSPLLDLIRENLPPDSRYAIAPRDLDILPPNLNAAFGLASLHSYNSLSSRRYHALIDQLGGKMLTYGRWNYSISPDFSGTMFFMSNTSLILSPIMLGHSNLEYLGQLDKIHFHRVSSRMGCCLQATLAPINISPEGVQIADPRNLPSYRPSKNLDQGDLLELNVNNDSQTSLLILSQKFHQNWSAQALTISGWVDAMTTPVNGVFQGVVLPEHTLKVKMQFKPYARFSWIAHVFWLLFLAALALQAIRQRIKSHQG